MENEVYFPLQMHQFSSKHCVRGLNLWVSAHLHWVVLLPQFCAISFPQTKLHMLTTRIGRIKMGLYKAGNHFLPSLQSEPLRQYVKLAWIQGQPASIFLLLWSFTSCCEPCFSDSAATAALLHSTSLQSLTESWRKSYPHPPILNAE